MDRELLRKYIFSTVRALLRENIPTAGELPAALHEQSEDLSKNDEAMVALWGLVADVEKAIKNPTAPSLIQENNAHAKRVIIEETNHSSDAHTLLVWDERIDEFSAPQLIQKYLSQDQKRFNTFIQQRFHPYCIALGHMRALTKPEHPTQYHQKISSEVIKKEEERDASGIEVDVLARTLLEKLQSASTQLRLEEVTPENLYNPPQEDEMFLFDARAAKIIESTGESGQEVAKQLRIRAKEIWKDFSADPYGAPVWSLCWANATSPFTPVRFVWNFTKALWNDNVIPKLEKERKKPPAVSSGSLHRVIEVAFTKEREVRKADNSSGFELYSKKGELLARSDTANPTPWLDLNDLESAQQAYDLLRSVNGHRILRSQIITTHRQYLDGAPRYNRIEIDGGWKEVAAWAGASKNDYREVSTIVRAEASSVVRWTGGAWGNLLLLEVYPGYRGQRPTIAMTVSDFLLPGAVNRLLHKDGTIQRQLDRQLAPIVGLPPFIGRPNEHAAQATLQLLIMAELRTHAEELILEGEVHLPHENFLRLADRAGVPKHILSDVLNRWLKDGPDGLAFLSLGPRGGYTLAPSYQVALDFITAGGSEALAGKKDTDARNKTKKKSVKKLLKYRKDSTKKGGPL